MAGVCSRRTVRNTTVGRGLRQSSAGLVWTVAKVALPLHGAPGIDHGVEQRRARRAAELDDRDRCSSPRCPAICTGMRRYIAFGVAYRAETDLRLKLFAHLQRLHFAFHDQSQTGQLMSRAATDLQQIQGFVVMIPITVSNLLTIVLVAGRRDGPSTSSWRCSRSSPLPSLNYMANRFSKQIHPVSMELQQELAGVSTSVEETVTGIRVVKGFGAEKRAVASA